MLLLLFLIFPFAEIYLFYKFVQAYSFLDAIIAILLSGVLGVFIMKLQGKATLQAFQQDLVMGKLPTTQILHRSLVVVGGLLLLVPGFLSDIFGILCILPGSRHLLVWYLKSMFAKGLLKGRVFVNGFGRSSNAGGATGFTYTTSHHREERDAQVVDIEPLEITHERKDD